MTREQIEGFKALEKVLNQVVNAQHKIEAVAGLFYLGSNEDGCRSILSDIQDGISKIFEEAKSKINKKIEEL